MDTTTYRDIAKNTAVNLMLFQAKQPDEYNPAQSIRIAVIDDTWRLWKNLWKPGMKKRGANLIKKYLVDDYGWNPEDFTIEFIEPYPNAIDQCVYLTWDNKFFE